MEKQKKHEKARYVHTAKFAGSRENETPATC